MATRSPGQFVLSPDASQAVFTNTGRYFGHPLFPDFGNDNNLFVVSLASGARRQLTAGTLAKTYPVFSPDGHMIAYESESDIWSVDVETGARARLTTNVAADRSAAWSPNGREIAFVSTRWNCPAIYVMGARGEREGIRRITPAGSGGALPTWSPDGRFLFFTATRGESFYSREIYRVPAAGGAVTRITPDDQARNNLPSFSPDGRLIAYISDRTGYLNVWTMKPDGSDQRQVTRVEQDQDYPENDHIQTMGLHWSPDGTRLLYFTNRLGNLDLMSVTVADGRTETIETADGEHHPVGWVDNRTVAYVYESYRVPPDLYVKQLGGGAPRQLTFSNHTAYRPEHFDTLESIVWTSEDGVKIHGYLRRPSTIRPGDRLPAIVMSHTYNVGQFYNQWNPIFSYIVQSGYVMLMVDHRGSNGYGVKFRDLPKGDWNLGQLKDIVSGAHFLKARPEVDPNRIGMMGYSMGGTMTFLAVATQPRLFKAAVEIFGSAEITGDPEHSSTNYVWHIGGTEAQMPEEYRKRSAITYVSQIDAPLLIIHSDGDPIVPIARTRHFIEAMEAAGKRYEAWIYPDEEHGLRRLNHQLDSYERIVAFLDRYVKQ